ncbi:MAG: DUF502 domain-containing protein [Leptolyngbyaceae bacterium]|nr:DUF502 domain-containing protein [Leptolyngbyaceae bacterium]
MTVIHSSVGRNEEIKSTVLQQVKQNLKNDLIAGLLVIIPLATTIWLSFTIAIWAINFLTRVPKQLNPFNDLHPFLVNAINLIVGFTVPLLFILFIGLMARNIAGRWLLDLGERLLQAIPLAGSVYKTLKQILETLLRDSNNKFRRVVMVEYPRKGIWAMAFVTGTVTTDGHADMPESMLSVIIPTTPNPTSGWFAIVPEKDVINLAISIEDAFKLLISGGIVGPRVLPTVAQKQVLSATDNDTDSNVAISEIASAEHAENEQNDPQESPDIQIPAGIGSVFSPEQRFSVDPVEGND